MFGTTFNYICLRILGEELNDEHDNACARARKWILDHGSVTNIPSWGKIWLSVCIESIINSNIKINTIFSRHYYS